MGTVVVAQAMQLMKSTGTRISSKSSVPDNCIVLKGEVLEYRDSLTHSANESGWIQRLHYDQSMA